MDDLAIVAQTTLIDVQPVSRYQPDEVDPNTVADEADVITHLAFPEPLPEGADPAELFGSRDATVSPDGMMVTLRDRVRVPVEKGWYQLVTRLPQPGTELANKGDDFSLLVLLPRAHLHGSGPAFDVVLENVTVDPAPKIREAGPVIFGVGGLPALGGRIGIAWHYRVDPENVIEYWYRQIRQHLPP